MATSCLSSSEELIPKLFPLWCKNSGLDIKPHQTVGFKWVLERELAPKTGAPGGFLCDEMGLGKTILMIGNMVLTPKAPSQKTLIVLPKCLLEQWFNAILKFTGIKSLVFHGAKTSEIKPHDLENSWVVITTYGMVGIRKKSKKYDCPLWNVAWDRIIFDESHHLRNSKTSAFMGAQKLKSPIKWMVTGTPINNKKTDFYNQSVIQGSSSYFKPSIQSIREIIKDIVLKRTKKQVGIKLPEKNTHIIEVVSKSVEEDTLIRNIHNLMSFAPVTPQNVNSIIQNLGRMCQSVLPIFMLMRQSCILPTLAYSSLERRAIINDMSIDGFDSPPTNSKMSAVVNKIVENKNTRKGKLVFCLFMKEMDHLVSELKIKGFNPITINGGSTEKQRRAALQCGPSESEWTILAPKLPTHIGHIINTFLVPNVLIAQIQTSCEGLNLQHFSEIYFTTPHWNPAVENQAVARCHRIGQVKPVDVYKFVTVFDKKEDNDSISLDQYCIEVQNMKKKIAQDCGL